VDVAAMLGTLFGIAAALGIGGGALNYGRKGGFAGCVWDWRLGGNVCNGAAIGLSLMLH